MRIPSCCSADGAGSAVYSCVGSGGVAYCCLGSCDAPRAVFLPGDRVARVKRRCREVFVFDLVVGLLSVVRTRLRVRRRSSVLVVCYA